MSDFLEVFVFTVLSLFLVAATMTVLAVLVWTRMPRLRTRLQKLVYSISGAFDPRAREVERRLNGLERAIRNLERDFAKEVRVGEKAEKAMRDILLGVTRSALRTDERLGALERDKN